MHILTLVPDPCLLLRDRTKRMNLHNLGLLDIDDVRNLMRMCKKAEDTPLSQQRLRACKFEVTFKVRHRLCAWAL